MSSEYMQEMANGRNCGSIFYFIVSLALFAVLIDLLVWVLQIHNRKNKDHFVRSVMLLIAVGAFLFFLVEGIKAYNLAHGLYIDSLRMETEEETGLIQEKYGRDHNLYIVIDGISYIYEETTLDQKVEIGEYYEIKYYKNSKLINKISEIDKKYKAKVF